MKKSGLFGVPWWVVIAAGVGAWWLFRPEPAAGAGDGLVSGGGGGDLGADLYLHEDGPIATTMPVPFRTLPPGLSGDHRYRGEEFPLRGAPVPGGLPIFTTQPVPIRLPLVGRQPPSFGHLPPGLGGAPGGPA